MTDQEKELSIYRLPHRYEPVIVAQTALKYTVLWVWRHEPDGPRRGAHHRLCVGVKR